MNQKASQSAGIKSQLLGLIDELRDLASRQADLMISEDTGPLLATLARKQGLAEKIFGLLTRYESGSGNPASSPLREAERTELAVQLGRMIEQDTEHMRQLSVRKAQTVSRISELSEGKTGNNAYAHESLSTYASFSGRLEQLG